MATMNPSQDAIDGLMGMCGLTAPQAALLLKKNNNDPDRAANDFFDNGERALQYNPPNEQWQETDNMPTFRIDRDETAASSILAAPSRPPSRASFNCREPIDLTAAHAAADASKVLSLQEQEELELRQMEEVMERSKLEAYGSAQENGVIRTEQQFGPATGTFYDQAKWAMVPSSANHVVREVFEHPRPSKRRRISDEPVFLRGSKETGYLGPLLTIYHSIPLAREALLLSSMKVHAYGYDPNWWNGTSDENDKSVSVEDPGVDKDKSNFLCEIQSLMGFLDASTRAYGSVDALADLRAYKRLDVEEPFSLLMEIWRQAAMDQKPDDQLTQVFNSYAVKGGNHPVAREFSFLDPPIQRSLGAVDTSIYDILDDAIWNDSNVTPLEKIWVGHCAQIFTIRLRDPSSARDGLQIKIPAIWYSDRYLDECQSITWAMRTQKQQLHNKVNKLLQIQQKYQAVLIPHSNRNLSIRLTLTTAKEATAIAMKDKVLPNGIHDDMQPLLSDLNAVSQSQLEECQTDLQSVLDRIDQKMQLLNQRIDQCREQYRLIGQALTQKSNNLEEPPRHRYFLQGVSTLPHVTYVRRRIEADLIDLDEDAVENEKDQSDWQWWRISFSRDDVASEELPKSGPVTEAEAQAAQMASANGTVSSNLSRKVRQASSTADAVGYSIRKVREYEVLKAVREESHQVLLVYADENAINFAGTPLDPALRAFINKDNQAFDTELGKEQAEQGAGTLQSSQGTDNQIFEDVPLYGNGTTAMEQLSTSFSREMTPTSMSSPKRDSNGDGQPSPKRPKSSDLYIAQQSPADDPPPYEARADGSNDGQEMQELSSSGAFLTQTYSNRIGQHSEKMMRRVEEADEAKESARAGGEGDVIHIEHSTTPLR